MGKNAIGFAFGFLLATIYFLSGCRHKPAEVSVAEYLIKHRLTTDKDSAAINKVLDTLLANTQWQSSKQLNRPYKQGLINVFIIEGSLSFIKEDEQLSKLIGNCSYAGSNIIFFDVAFRQTFLDKHHVIKSQFNVVKREEEECLLFWIIGYELGHLAHSHESAHFESGSLDTYVKNSTLNNKEELQADSFFVRCIQTNTRLRPSVERLMIGILNAEIQQKIGEIPTQGVGIIYDYTNQLIVEYAKQKTHPEYVIRLARMLELSSKMSGDYGLYNLVEGFIKQLKEVQ